MCRNIGIKFISWTYMYTTLLLFLGKCERQREMVGRRRQTDGRTDRRERDGRERQTDRQTDRQR